MPKQKTRIEWCLETSNPARTVQAYILWLSIDSLACVSHIFMLKYILDGTYMLFEAFIAISVRIYEGRNLYGR